MPKKRREVTEAEWKQAGLTLAKLRRCKAIYPLTYGIFCKKTTRGPFYLAGKAKRGQDLPDRVAAIKKREGYPACFITILQDACIPPRTARDDWLRVKKWKKKGS